MNFIHRWQCYNKNMTLVTTHTGIFVLLKGYDCNIYFLYTAILNSVMKNSFTHHFSCCGTLYLKSIQLIGWENNQFLTASWTKSHEKQSAFNSLLSLNYKSHNLHSITSIASSAEENFNYFFHFLDYNQLLYDSPFEN